MKEKWVKSWNKVNSDLEKKTEIFERDKLEARMNVKLRYQFDYKERYNNMLNSFKQTDHMLGAIGGKFEKI